MHYFVCVRLDSFYARELTRQVPDLERETFVVLDGKTVLDASDDATAKGVVQGMPCSQAKALLASARYIERNHDDFKKAQIDWLNVLTSFTDVIEPLDQHEAIFDLSNHPRSVEVAELAIAALAAKSPRVVSGFGESKWIARLALEFGRSFNETDPTQFLSALPVHSLTLLSTEAREKLILLGYRDVGSLRAIPLEVLSGQFGTEGLLIHRLARAQHFEPVEPLYPERSISGQFHFQGSTDCLETVAAGYAALARKLGDKLNASDQETSDLVLHIECELSVITFTRTFSKPICNYLSLLASVRLLLEDKIKEPVYSIRATLPNLKRARRVQNGLFLQSSDNERRLTKAVLNVHSVFGQTSLCRGSEIELPRRVRLLKELGQIVGWR